MGAEAPALVLVAAVARAGARSLALVPRLGSEFLPELNEGSIWVNVPLPPEHLGHRSAQEMHARCADAIRSVPEVRA